MTQSCCQQNHTHLHSASGGYYPSPPEPYDPVTHICCDGSVSWRDPWTDRCCGKLAYGLAQRGVLCCGGTLYNGREDGEVCPDRGIPYNPAVWTKCSSQMHFSPGFHCCGTGHYNPQTEICCRGNRWSLTENSYCCGVRAYNIKDTQMKCCKDTLHDLSALGQHAAEAHCCGSILATNASNVCCSSEGEELLYPDKTGHQCCGHNYYNTSLWWCCAGRLRPVSNTTPHHNGNVTGSTFLSVNNLKLCYGIYIGMVESVSTSGIVFSSVLKINGRNGTVTPLPSPYSLRMPDRCTSPKLTPGRIYFFDEHNRFFTNSNYHSVLQSLHFIIAKCFLS
ncbi:uncharacterized protein LOC142992667 [Genypterus blacodes]|uniref:uncharacterized protein LOC142992667 n=1 Tax=Genypterus blacodes TaxID=154954 RepID=UPI003F7590F6